MLRTSDEAKNCTCPVFYESEAKLLIANQIPTMDSPNGFKVFCCDGDRCMAWATNQGSKGYCKLVFKDGV